MHIYLQGFLIILFFFGKTIASAQDSFVTTWQTTTTNESITIPTEGGGYNYNVDWGDGNIDTGLGGGGGRSHIYATPGVYTVEITGDFPQIFFNNLGDKDKILTIEQWGDNPWTSMEGAFNGCTNLNITNPLIDTPNLSSVTFMASMFEGATSFNYDISNWDTSNVVNMNDMFNGAISFNQNIANWNIENLNSAVDMFRDVTLSTENYDALLIGWNAQNLQSNVTFSGGNSLYCDGESARTNMISSYGWTIIDAGKAGPIINNLVAQNEVDSFAFPEITGTNLTGIEAYYTGPDGTGTQYNAGDSISYNIAETYPITLYIFDGSGSCISEESFQLTLTEITPCLIDVNGVTSLSEMDSFTLPPISGVGLTGNGAYYSGTCATGTRFLGGDVIVYDQLETYPITFYIYDGTTTCFDEEMFQLTLIGDEICISATADVLFDQEVCDEFVLPSLSPDNFYFTESEGLGEQLFPGDIITNTQLIYIYTGTSNTCFDESSFFVFVEDCEEEASIIPEFFTPNGDGFNDLLIANNSNSLEGSVFIYDRHGRLLKQFDINSGSWDGTFGGRDMPTDSYWYCLKTDNLQEKGYFMLKR